MSKPLVHDWEFAIKSSPRVLNADGLLLKRLSSLERRAIMCRDTNKEKVFVPALIKSGFNELKFDEKAFLCGFFDKNTDWYGVIFGYTACLLDELYHALEKCPDLVSGILARINFYILNIEKYYSAIESTNTKPEDERVISAIAKAEGVLQGKKISLVNAGFSNKIYETCDLIIRVCNSPQNEQRFLNEQAYYKTHKTPNMPKLFACSNTKQGVPFYYTVIEKINGQTLYRLWHSANKLERCGMINKLVEALKPMHTEKLPDPGFKQMLLDKISGLKGFIPNDILEKLNGFTNENFNSCDTRLIHNDLHFDNVLLNNEKLFIIDYERVTAAPIDYEFKYLSACRFMPWLWASVSTDILSFECDYQEITELLLGAYPELRAIPNVKKRLLFYAITELANNYKNTRDPWVLNIITEQINNI